MKALEASAIWGNIQDTAWTDMVECYNVDGTDLFESGTTVNEVDAVVERDVGNYVESVLDTLQDSIAHYRLGVL